MLKIDDREIKRFEQDLKRFAHRAYPFATKATVNSAAFKARELWQENIRNAMVTRNRFTVQSIRVEQTKTLNVNRQAAIVGSTADYMEDQEFGGTKVKTGREGISIATGYSAGQRGQQPRTRLPRKPNKLRNIQLSKRRKMGGSRKSRNVGLIKNAAATGNKFIFLDFGRRKGIFKVVGGKRKPKINMVHDMSRSSVDIPRNPTLLPATQETQREIPRIYRDALVFQLKRLRLFRGGRA